MTKISIYKNRYGHDEVRCPFCAHTTYARAVMGDRLKSLKRHITNQAKNEAFALATGESINNAHLEYYKKHTAKRPIVTPMIKRQYDDDLTHD